MKDDINVYIGTCPGMELACDTLVCSIMENTSKPDRVKIHLMEAWGPEAEWRWWHAQPDYRDPEMCGKGYWVTPFTLFRYAIPYVQTEGFAIYLDADMIMLGDIQRLYDFRVKGKWAIAANQDGDCVMVMDCAATQDDNRYPPFDQLKGGTVDKHGMRSLTAKYKVPVIPETWNRHDDFVAGQTQLIHFTSIATQPWHPFPDAIDYKPHPSQAAVDKWNEWSERAKTWQLSKSA